MESTRAGAMRLCPGRVPLPLGPRLCGILNANFRECYLAEAQFPRIPLIGNSLNNLAMPRSLLLEAAVVSTIYHLLVI